MKKIADLVCQIDEELEDAKTYAETYLDKKAAGDSQWASRYREMATDELKHAGYIHDVAVEEINRLRTVYTPPAEMEEKWDLSHKKYIERAAWIKQIMSM